MKNPRTKLKTFSGITGKRKADECIHKIKNYAHVVKMSLYDNENIDTDVCIEYLKKVDIYAETQIKNIKSNYPNVKNMEIIVKATYESLILTLLVGTQDTNLVSV